MKFLLLTSILLSCVSSYSQAQVTGCATGFQLVAADPARGFGSFCISTNAYQTNGQDFAVTGCSNGQGYLCSTMEYQQACMARVITTTAGSLHFTSDLGVGSYQRISMKLWGGAHCWDKQDAFVSAATLRPYRCCTR